jgi:hypothetical protein
MSLMGKESWNDFARGKKACNCGREETGTSGLAKKCSSKKKAVRCRFYSHFDSEAQF